MSNPVSTIISQVVARCAGLSALIFSVKWIAHHIHAGFLPAAHATAAAHPEAFNVGYSVGYSAATVIGGIGSIALIVFGLLFLIVPGYGTTLLVRVFAPAR
jgi:hypothetical protein